MSQIPVNHTILALVCQIIREIPDDFAKTEVAEADRLWKGGNEIQKTGGS